MLCFGIFFGLFLFQVKKNDLDFGIMSFEVIFVEICKFAVNFCQKIEEDEV